MAQRIQPGDRCFYAVLVEEIADAIEGSLSLDPMVEAMAVMDLLTSRFEDHFDGLVIGDGRGMEIEGRRYIELLFSLGH